MMTHSAKEIRKQKEQGMGRKRWTKFEKGGVDKIGGLGTLRQLWSKSRINTQLSSLRSF